MIKTLGKLNEAIVWGLIIGTYVNQRKVSATAAHLSAGMGWPGSPGDVSAGWVGLRRVRSRLPKPQPIRLVQGGEEGGQGDTECPGQAIHHIHGRALLAAFQITDIGPMESGAVRECFLRKVQPTSQLAYPFAQRRSEIFHAGIVTMEWLAQP